MLKILLYAFPISFLVALFAPPIFYAAYLGPEFVDYILKDPLLQSCAVLLFPEAVDRLVLGLPADMSTTFANRGFLFNIIGFSTIALGGSFVWIYIRRFLQRFLAAHDCLGFTSFAETSALSAGSAFDASSLRCERRGNALSDIERERHDRQCRRNKLRACRCYRDIQRLKRNAERGYGEGRLRLLADTPLIGRDSPANDPLRYRL